MLWIAWLNGSLYVELHGREDGRTRMLVFLQMGILVLLAVFTANAASSTGWPFAIVYAVFLAVMTWQWRSVRELDRTERPEFLAVTKWYVGGMAASTVAVAASSWLPTDARLIVWAAYCITWVVGIYIAGRDPRVGITDGVAPTESLVERVGSFTIIVLGEVILGAVAGLSAVEPDAMTILTGLLALVIGFGLWWIYFDIVGRRLPRSSRARSPPGCSATYPSRCPSPPPAPRSSASSSTPTTPSRPPQPRGSSRAPSRSVSSR